MNTTFCCNKLLKKTTVYLMLAFMLVNCKQDPQLDARLEISNILCFPEVLKFPNFNTVASMDLSIIADGRNAPLQIKWAIPAGYEGFGPFSVQTDSILVLDFELMDAALNSKHFSFVLDMDTMARESYDYRNNFIGEYSCNRKYTNANKVIVGFYTDTLTVVKGATLLDLYIKTSYDVENNRKGNEMNYIDINSFYGYHSGVRFSNDSIFYTASGPLGDYYTNEYTGVKITDK